MSIANFHDVQHYGFAPYYGIGGLLFGGPRTDFKLKNGSLEVFERCFEYLLKFANAFFQSDIK